MATLVLGAVGAAIGGSIGGSVIGLSGAVIGRAVGATLGRAIDQSVMGGGADVVETGRLERLRLTGASEGAAIPRLVGRSRVAGQVIWASRFQEHRTTVGGGGKGAPKPPSQTQYSYSISLALALCEGEITRVGRIWADGTEVAKPSLDLRVYRGTEEQMPDALIEAIEGTDHAPAFRGTAYVVIEGLDLTPFGNRVPQLSFEVVRHAKAPGEVPGPAELIEGVALVPGSGEYALATTAVHYNNGRAGKDSANVNTPQGIADFKVALEDLTEELPNLKSASLIVSWFGTDLRCGQCRVEPRVEQTRTDGRPQRWNVSGLGRRAAQSVPFLDDRPVYGGTPSDASVVEAIRALNDRGVAVTFYPFILMEQMVGNGLPDPYGGAEQAALPWRGRITTSLAPGQAGSPDRTVQAAEEVAAFFGTTSPTAFAAQAPASGLFRNLVVDGPEGDWSYRRFILHYAHLCAAAGGVEAFCIGSELRGLTQVRGAGDSFPAVEALRRLAADVKAILPGAKISYAADWSEYFGYQPQDTGNVHFHLDPLWASEAIDFIGIDLYTPLADWRDGRDHADAGAESILNLDYLRDNIEGGEGYDWYYTTPEARADQRRAPIEDGAHDEPWIYRFKDMRNWWGQYHHDRIDGQRAPLPTQWEPRSKPIRFTEFGCAAIDKGANQPNAFVDEKSSESVLPRFSNGRRDDMMQMQYLRALLSYWGAPENNPASDLYDGAMIDLGHSLAWAWDTRPWPYFPELTEFWSDGVNHARGHWISGRTANQPLASVITEICHASGLTRIDVSRVWGVVRGYVMTAVQSGRADLQPLMMAYGVEASERDGMIVFFMRANAAETVVDPAYFVRGKGPVIDRTRSPEAETARRVLLGHIDANGDFDLRQAEASLPTGAAHPVSQSEVPLSLTRGEAQGLAERYLAAARVGRDTLELELAPSCRAQKAGDLIRLDGTSDLWRIDRLEDAGGRRVQAVRTERALFEPSDHAEDGTGRVRPLAPLPVDAAFMDLPLLTGDEVPHAPYLAVAAVPWPGSVAVHGSSDDSNYRLNRIVETPSLLGVTETELAPAMPGVYDDGPELQVRMTGGDLEAASEAALLAGANAMAINHEGVAGWEIFQFQSVRLIEPGLWGLTRRLRGQRGTEWAMRQVRPIGSRVVLLDASLTQLDLAREAVGRARHFRVGPAGLPLDNPAFDHFEITAHAEGLRPYAPVHLRKRVNEASTVFSWVRRTRLGGDNWDLADVPLSEARERYLARVLSADGAVVHEQTVSEPKVSLTASQVGGGGQMRFAVAQISDEVGPGPFAEIAI